MCNESWGFTVSDKIIERMLPMNGTGNTNKPILILLTTYCRNYFTPPMMGSKLIV